MQGAGYWDDMPVTTAVGLIAPLNGPGYFVFNALSNIFRIWLFVPYLGCAAYWGWIGYVLDRRRRGNLEPVLTSQRLRLAFYCMGLAVASAILFGAVESPSSPLSNPKYLKAVWGVITGGSHKRLLLGRQMASIAGAMWATSYVVYFLVKLWRLALTWN